MTCTQFSRRLFYYFPSTLIIAWLPSKCPATGWIPVSPAQTETVLNGQKQWYSDKDGIRQHRSGRHGNHGTQVRPDIRAQVPGQDPHKGSDGSTGPDTGQDQRQMERCQGNTQLA